jgi:TetR/AcrR family transcriptional regulator, transcriptional repressor for nem operon
VPRNGSETRERILAAAEALVIENGFTATSLDQVIGASHTSKGAFFHHFDGKQALADALVERYVAADLADLDDALSVARRSRTPAAQVTAFLRWFENQGDALIAEHSSCLYTSVLVEQQLIDAGSGEPIARAVEEWRRRFGELLRAARPRAAQEEIDDLADHLFATFEGAFMLVRSTGDPGHMRRQLRTYRRLVQRWMG